MTPISFLKIFGGTAATMFVLDLTWLGLVAKGLYARQMGSLLRADVKWLPAVLFYMVYVVAVIVFVVIPAAERRSLARAVGMGAFFGFAAYATYDLTSLALIRDFPVAIALIDMAWGTALTAVAASAGYALAAGGAA